MKKILMLTLLALFCGSKIHAQSIGPLYVEGKGKIKSQFTMTNNGVIAMPMTVEARQIVLQNGQPQLLPLSSEVKVELHDTSAVVGPKQSHAFDYKVSCETDCVVVLMAGMVQGKTKEGVQVKLWLPHSVYLCKDSAKDCRDRLRRLEHMDQVQQAAVVQQ